MSGTTRLRWIGVVGALTALVTLAMPVSPAAAADPPFIGWTAQLAPLPVAYNPNSSDICVAGKASCVQGTISKMTKRYAPLSASCAHTGVFALTYLDVTKQYLKSATTPGFYADPAFVNHEDSVFASLYFSAYDNWAAGKLANVPLAWRLAFDAAKSKQVTASGDLLLGINAHVNRDLPFTLAAIGLTKPDGTSRKPDHDKVDTMLNTAVVTVVNDLAAHYDSTLTATQGPASLGYTSLMQLLVAWRETAWREAEQLVAAPTAAAKATVAATIENTAAAEARTIIAGNSFLPPVTTTASRDAQCAAYVAAGG